MKRPEARIGVEAAGYRGAVRRGRAALPSETGGVLIGHYQDGSIVVVEFLEVLDPRASAFAYQRDNAAGAEALAEYRSAHGQVNGYVGEWHTHPAPIGPSSQDRRSLRQLSAASDQPLALIVLSYCLASHTRTTALVCAPDRAAAARAAIAYLDTTTEETLQ